MTEQAADWPVFKLMCDIVRFDATAADRAALAAAIDRIGWNTLLDAADQYRLGSVVVDAVDRLALSPDVPAFVLPGGRMTIPLALQQRKADHDRHRAIFGRRLDEIAGLLNGRGIVPIVLKGGRSIATGESPWRSLRDLDLLVAADQAETAQSILLEAGYTESATPRPRRFHHHLRELYRPDLPGWIEIHHRGGSSRVEQFLPTAELTAASIPVRLPGGASAAVLARPHQVLNGMVHHHIGHRAVKLAFIHPKGLYEFAAELAALDADEQVAMAALAARHPRVLAIFELWSAAARELFGAAIPSTFTIDPDAEAWWLAIRGSLQRLGPGALADQGIGAEWRAATNTARMKRCRGGLNPLRRAYWRVTTPLSFSKKPSLPG